MLFLTICIFVLTIFIYSLITYVIIGCDKHLLKREGISVLLLLVMLLSIISFLLGIFVTII